MLWLRMATVKWEYTVAENYKKAKSYCVVGKMKEGNSGRTVNLPAIGKEPSQCFPFYVIWGWILYTIPSHAKALWPSNSMAC